MFVLGNFLIALSRVLQMVIYAYIFVLIINSILSFVSPSYYSPIRQFFATLANLTLNPLRRLIRPIGGIDLAPFVAVLILIFIDSFLVQSLAHLGMRLR